MKERNIKNVLFRMWLRVETGREDARSFVGDTALSLRDAIYHTENLDVFWQEYEDYKKEQPQ